MKVTTTKCDGCSKTKSDDAGNGEWLQAIETQTGIIIESQIQQQPNIKDFCGVDCLISAVRLLVDKITIRRREMDEQDKAMDRA